MNCGSTNTSQTTGQRQIEVNSDNQSSCRTGLTTALSVAGGLGIGAALMYLLDPEEGADRRKNLTHIASGALSTTGSALESGWSSLKDTAGRVYDAASEGAGAFKDKLSDGADYVADSRYGRSISKSARRAKAEGSDRLDYLLHGRRSHGLESGLSQGIAAVACLAVGVGAMYFLDPRDGARRRTVFRDKFLSAFGRMATSLEKQGRNLMNRTKGLASNARSSMSREQVDDQTLTDRIRATIGRYTDNVGAIEVQCVQGQVTLRGPIMASQLNRLLKATRGVRGVSGIDNQLDVRSQPQDGTAQRQRPYVRQESSSGIGAPLCPPGTSTTSTTQI